MSSPIPLRMSAQAAVRLVRQRAEASSNVIVTDHAAERMAERGITFDDVMAVLCRGQVYLPPYVNERRDWQAEVEKRMPGGRDAAVITVIPLGENLIVRTVMWRDER